MCVRVCVCVLAASKIFHIMGSVLEVSEKNDIVL